MQVISWLVLFIVLLVIEIITLGLTTIWFAGGALVACVLAAFGVPLPIQLVVFVVVSVMLFIGTRPVAVKYFNKDRTKTNAESLIGETALVLEEIDTIKAAGKVEVKGQEWSAKTDDPSGTIPKGTLVVVEGIQGVKLIVKKKEEQ